MKQTRRSSSIKVLVDGVPYPSIFAAATEIGCNYSWLWCKLRCGQAVILGHHVRLADKKDERNKEGLMTRIQSFTATYPPTRTRSYGGGENSVEMSAHADGAGFRWSFRLRLGRLFRSEYQTDGEPLPSEEAALSAARARILKTVRGHKPLLARLAQTGYPFDGDGQLSLF